MAAVVLGALAGRFVLAGGSERRPPAAPAPAPLTATALVADLQERLRATPDDAGLLARLGVAYLDRARETADPGYYGRAATALERSHALDPGGVEAQLGLGVLALARHDFAAALGWAQRAQAAVPGAAEPSGIAYDALVELGRYQEAEAALQAMTDRRPSLAALVRVSQLRELHGDRPGAIAAATAAVNAGSRRPADLAFAETVVGDLHLGGGDLALAGAAYDRALRHVADHAPALVGRARVAAAGGDLRAAVAGLEPVVARVPQPAWVALLGDLHRAAGRPAEAVQQYALVRAIEDLNRASGVAVDLELARFEADLLGDWPDGPGADAVVAAARAAREGRPTVYGDDTLGWALRQAGRPAEALAHAEAAVRLGTADAILWYHLAAVEADLGLRDRARDHLARAFALNRHLTVRDRPPALALAAELGVTAP